MHTVYCKDFLKLKREKEKAHSLMAMCFCVGIYLFSRAASRQVSSAQVSLTSVFGMGTGGPSPQSTPTIFVCHLEATLI